MSQSNSAYVLKRRHWVFVAALPLALMLAGAKCEEKNKYIDKAIFTPSQDLTEMSLDLVFTDKIKLNYKNKFKVKDHGYIYIQDYKKDERPFAAGFKLKTAVVDEQDYVNLTPTSVLPNGIAIGIEHPLAEIRGEDPIDPSFDLMGYVDILNKSWLGAAVLFSFANEQDYVPYDVTLTQVFKRDAMGKPSIMAHIFGAVPNEDGTLKRQSGLAVFVNVRDLIESGDVKPGIPAEYRSE